MSTKTPSFPTSALTAIAVMRITLGFYFLWAFLDKLIGLGYSTCRNVDTQAIETMCNKAWLAGGSPTTGFLKFGTSGPMADFYQALAGNAIVDWLFMLGLLGIGLSLILGVAIRLGTISGIAMMILMYTAALWPDTNPLLDDHIIYAIAFVVIMLSNQHQVLGLGRWWSEEGLGAKFTILK